MAAPAKPTPDATKFILDFISDNWVVETERLVPDAMLVADLGADSLDMVELDVALEDAFGIEVPDNVQIHGMRVRDYAEFVEKRIAEKRAAAAGDTTDGARP